MIEKEKKFKIKKLPKLPKEWLNIEQAYMFYPKKRHLRVRIVNKEQGFLTLKHAVPNSEDRYEFEYVIPLRDAKQITELCKLKLIKKRYIIKKTKDYEIILDVYENLRKNGKKLYVAEIEFYSDKELKKLPSWISEDITGNKKYSNINLAKLYTRKKYAL